MAVTATLAKATPHSLQYNVVHDGLAGDTLVLTNAVMLGDAVAGPLRDLLSEAFNPNSTALARARMLGAAAGADMSDIPHCACFFTAQIVVGADVGGAAVDADVDAVAAGNFELNLLATAGIAATYQLLIKFQHTTPR